MRRYSPPPRRGHGGRPGSPPPRRGYGGERGRPKDQNQGSLLVRNIPLNCRPEELRVPFERFGVVRDVYLPKNYYTGEPRGFAFVQFVDPYDAAEAQYHMNGRMFAGREISVVLATESRKRPEDMRRIRGPSGHEGRRSYQGRSRSRSRSPRHPPTSRRHHRSRSCSPGYNRDAEQSVDRKLSAVCGSHLQTSAEEEVVQTSTVCKKKTVCFLTSAMCYIKLKFK